VDAEAIAMSTDVPHRRPATPSSAPLPPPVLGVGRAIVGSVVACAVLTTTSFLVTYAVARASENAPKGDTTFAWMPMVYLAETLPLWLCLAALTVLAVARPLPRRVGTWATALILPLLVALPLFALLWTPDWNGTEGFPTDPGPLIFAAIGLVVSLLPAVALGRWLAQREALPRTPWYVAVVLSVLLVLSATVYVPLHENATKRAQWHEQLLWDDANGCAPTSEVAVLTVVKSLPWEIDVTYEMNDPVDVGGTCTASPTTVYATFADVKSQMPDLLESVGMTGVEEVWSEAGTSVSYVAVASDGTAVRVSADALTKASGPAEVVIDVSADDS